MQVEKKLCVIFPGLGYHADKPLLYYSAKLARSAGYEIVSVSYENMPVKVLGDANLMRIAFERAMDSAERQLKQIFFGTYRQILFIGKSIGTVVGAAYAQKHELNVQGIWYTPLAETFDFKPEGIAFHGTKDPWANTETVTNGCRNNGIQLFITPNANHSLETGDIPADISELKNIMCRTREFIK